METRDLVALDHTSLGAWAALTLFGIAYLVIAHRRTGKLAIPALSRKRLKMFAFVGALILLTSLSQIVATFFFPVVVTPSYIARVLLGRSSDLIGTALLIGYWLWLERSSHRQESEMAEEERRRRLREHRQKAREVFPGDPGEFEEENDG